MIDILMVIMASGIPRGHPYTITASSKMAAMLQLMDWPKHEAPIYSVHLWFWTTKLWGVSKTKTSKTKTLRP